MSEDQDAKLLTWLKKILFATPADEPVKRRTTFSEDPDWSKASQYKPSLGLDVASDPTLAREEKAKVARKRPDWMGGAFDPTVSD